MIKKIIFLIIFSLGLIQLKGMEADRPSYELDPSEMPAEIMLNIVLTGINNAPSIEDAGKFLANFAQTNWQFNNLINNETNKNLIINALAQKIKTTEEAEQGLMDFATKDIGSNIGQTMIDSFLKAGADINSVLYKAVITQRPEIVEALLRAGANPNAIGKRSFTMLGSAVTKENPNLVKILLEAGADVNAKDESGKTAYDWLTFLKSDSSSFTNKELEIKKILEEALRKS